MPKNKTTYHKPVFERIPSQKRNRIISVAIGEFANNGYNNANINIIAKKAEVSVGSLYKYFNTKTDLFLTCVNYGVETIEKVLESVVASDEDIIAKLEKIIRIAVDFSKKQGVIIKLYNEITGETDEELVKTLSHSMEAMTVEAYVSVIEEGQRTGKIRSDISPGMAAFFVDTLIMGMQFSYACDYYSERYKLYAGDDIFTKDNFAIDEFIKFIKSALKADNAK